MVGVKGERNPEAKGRKGYLVYVSKTGKKKLLKTHKQSPYKPTKLTDLEPADYPNLSNKIKQFTKAKRSLTRAGKIVLKGSGSVGNGPWDFSDKMVDKMAKGIRDVIERQASRRSFILTSIVLIKLPDGTSQSLEIQVPIDKPDHIAIALGGIINFLRMKFYGFMARQLARLGYVSSGSNNHIRHLEENSGVDDADLVDGTGHSWKGIGKQVVRIKRIDWQLEQAK